MGIRHGRAISMTPVVQIGTRALALAGFALALCLATPSPARAATLHVTSSADGAGQTLRNVIATAAAGDTVVIDPGVNPSLTAGEIAIDKSLTIRGQGASQTTVSAN